MGEYSERIYSLLKLHYGYDKFRPGQEQAIANVLAGKPTVVIMPTGGGKSLIFQLTALVLPGVTVVVSPLIALMKDQADGMVRIGVPATFINSSLSFAETARRLDDVRSGVYKLVYIAPERFYSSEFMAALADVKVSLFAVDEAHCISQWGHDFRPSYLKLREAIAALGRPTILALTATATPEVRLDIGKQLGIDHPEYVITGFSRPNLQFGVIQASEAEKPRVVLEAAQSMPDSSGIIYAGTRARAEEIAQILLDQGIEAAVYHAGLDPTDRDWVQANFMSGQVKVIVATNAFGLGVDKPDVRFVIHYDMPGTVEAYYQEAGRAGRDGLPSFCLLLYNSRDRRLQEFFIKGDNPPPESVLDIYDLLVRFDRSPILITYSEIMEMLGSDVPEMGIGTSLKILEREGLIRRNRERSGSAHLRLLAGSTEILAGLEKKAKKSHELFRRLYDRFARELEAGWDVNLEEAAALIEAKKESLVRLVKKLNESGQIEYTPPFKGTEIEVLKRLPKHLVELDFSALREKMKRAYEKLDKIEDYVFHFGCRPQYILDHFGDRGSAPCGQCDNCLGKSRFSRPAARPARNYLDGYEDVTTDSGGGLEAEPERPDRPKLATKLTQLETFELYRQGLSIAAMAKERGLAESTVVEHLCFLLEKKLPIEIDRLVRPERQKKIQAALAAASDRKLRTLKDALGEGFSYDEIKLTLASLAGK